MVDLCVCLDGMKQNIYNQDTELEIWKVLWPYLFWAETYANQILFSYTLGTNVSLYMEIY